ncbi:MAG: 3-phosphoshikimate 1-carboxyvinyltransferase [Caulobacteraceae bacterium]
MAETGSRARWSGALRGLAQIPGDKSISHRALILGALARGETLIEGLLEGADVRATAAAMVAFGADVSRAGEGRWRVVGAGELREPSNVIDCGNSGTGARLILGAAAGFDIAAAFTGDASLRERPMMRVLTPLGLMGARHISRAGGHLPLMLRGGGLKGVTYDLPEPSAQVKSAILLAGLRARGETVVIEPRPSRDHTERMLAAFGARLEIAASGSGRAIRLAGGQALTGTPVRVPADPSSAAFPLVAALITPGSQVTAHGVLLNPLRAGLFETLREMGADLAIANRREVGGECVGDITARSSALRGVSVPAERAPSMIDEYPILAVAAAFASSPTAMGGIGELRLKESDRIAAIAEMLGACGVQVEEEPDGLIVAGNGGAKPAVRGGARVRTQGDHRIAMSALVLGLATQTPVEVDEPHMIDTSFPGFSDLMRGLGAAIEDG